MTDTDTSASNGATSGTRTPDGTPPDYPLPKYPPYAPYQSKYTPPTVSQVVEAGRTVRYACKNKETTGTKRLPMMAKPKTPKATDIWMSKKEICRHATCLRKHTIALTENMARMAKPSNRHIISQWRQWAPKLPPEMIARFRSLLDADEPMPPDQAYQMFVNLKRTKRMLAKQRRERLKKGLHGLCGDHRFVWARNATVSLAKGIKRRLAPPTQSNLDAGMLRLSNLVLNGICCMLNMRPPPRNTTKRKSQFILEMADKVTIWIDEIMLDADNRLLMMDFDEDEEIEKIINQRASKSHKKTVSRAKSPSS